MTARQIITERITVGLIPKAVTDMAALQASTGLNKADLINRAVSLYAFVQAQLDDHREVLIRDANGDVGKVHFL